MKKVTAFVGTASRKHTQSAVREFLDDLEALGGVECETVTLSDYDIRTCRGCKICFEKGEGLCPLRDDRDLLIEKMLASDGVVFASPNYMFQVSGMMKVFIDRLGFIGHRPRFHGKTFTSIVVQGIYGGRKLIKYLSFVARGIGFDVVKGSYFTAFDPMTEKERQKRDKALARHAKRFHKQLPRSADRAPTLFELMVFRMARTRMKILLDDSSRDYIYYRDHGWFDSDYYYSTHLGLLKRLAGVVFDLIYTRMSKRAGD